MDDVLNDVKEVIEYTKFMARQSIIVADFIKIKEEQFRNRTLDLLDSQKWCEMEIKFYEDLKWEV